jgi:hypothetical protein
MRIAMILRGEPVRALEVCATVLVCAVFYGAVAGSAGEHTIGDRPLQILYTAIKLPLLLGLTFALTLPTFYVINALAGVGEDFPHAMRALLRTHAVMTIVLASFAPVTMFWYFCFAQHDGHILFNAAVFTLASFVAQIILRREYRPLIARNRIHLRLIRAWLVVYAFVGIQVAWVLRPFIGDPGLATQFVRDNAWTNAYVWVARAIVRNLFHG